MTEPMNARCNPLITSVSAAAAVVLFSPVVGAADADGAEVKLSKSETRVDVTVGGKPFTSYVFTGRTKPILYPLHGPGGVRMNRAFPLDPGVEGEAHDHPHHESLWYTHGDVNGVSFWHVGEKTGTVVNTGVEVEGATITAENAWRDHDGKTLCTDTTVITFGVAGGARFIDYTVTLHASDGDVTFGDTKEGTMGIRSHPNLRVSNDEKRGVTTANGKAINSAGDVGKDLWGKAAAWVDYSGEIDGETVGFAIFDHPGNPRHPTTWHARDYGLVAANPFGLSYFQKKEKGAGDMVIKNGGSVTFRYRFLFHEGDSTAANIGWQYEAWAR